MDIKSRIKEQGFTLEQVASKMPNSRTGEVGISKQTMTQVVGGNPQVSTLRSIADIIGCDILDFFKDEASHQPDSGTSVSCPHCGKPINIKVE